MTLTDFPATRVGEKERREARRRYITAALRVKYQALSEIGKLLDSGHIDEDTALDMYDEVKELHFR